MKSDFYSRYYGSDEIPHGVPFAVRSVGYNHCAPGYRYGEMLKKHPLDHQFSEKKGRLLDTLTIAHVTRGSGRFYTKESGEIKISSNTVFVVFPGVKHWYRYYDKTGWDAEWVEMMPESAMPMLAQFGITPDSPVRRFNVLPTLTGEFRELIRLSRENHDEHGILLAAMANRVLAEVISIWHQGTLKLDERTEIGKVDSFRSSMEVEGKDTISVAEAARASGLSEQRMRALFKKHIGMSPKKYQLEHRIARSREMLATTALSVTAVAAATGFESLYSFSRQFRKSVGVSPIVFRRGARKC